MSLFGKLIASALDTGSSSAVMKDVNPAHLLPAEVALHEFVVGHIQRHGRLPSARTIQAAGMTLPTFEEPVSYYVERLGARFAYNVINERHPQLLQSLQSKNMPQALHVLREMVRLVGSSVERSAASTLVAEVSTVLAEYNARKLQGGLCGISFGWPSLDAMTLGAMGGDLVVIAGRPNMGKSWLLFEMAYQAWLSGKSIAVVSMEMGKLQVTRRWMGRHLGINPNFIRSGQVSTWMEQSLLNYEEGISQMPRVSLMSGDMDKQMEAIEHIMQENLPDVLYVDAAYLLSPSGRTHGFVSKWESISEVVRELKRMAIRFDRPIIITVQFNRNQKSASKKELDLGDIAGSDSIPQDASIVLGTRHGLPPFDSIRRQVVVMKNREGETGEFLTNFLFTPPDFTEVIGGEEETPEALNWMA